MATDSYNEVPAVPDHFDHINALILKLVGDENAAFVLACQVFQDDNQIINPSLFEFTPEAQMGLLEARAIEISATYLKRKKRERIKTEAIQEAIHAWPQAAAQCDAVPKTDL